MPKTFLAIWWMGGGNDCPTCGRKRNPPLPHAALFRNPTGAEAAANVRNALLVTITGRDARVEQVQDWYLRDEAGQPMPAEWRDLEGQKVLPWMAAPHPRT